MLTSVQSATLTMVKPLTAAITTVLAKAGGAEARGYDQIDAAQKKRRGITISTAR